MFKQSQEIGYESVFSNYIVFFIFAIILLRSMFAKYWNVLFRSMGPKRLPDRILKMIKDSIYQEFVSVCEFPKFSVLIKTVNLQIRANNL